MKLTPTKHGLRGEAETPSGNALLVVIIFADKVLRNPFVQAILCIPVVKILIWANGA